MTTKTKRSLDNNNLLWAILLIAVGGIWLLEANNVFSFSFPQLGGLLILAARYWPVILIAIGVNMLLGSRYANLRLLLNLAMIAAVAVIAFAAPALGWVQIPTLQTFGFNEPVAEARSATVNLSLGQGETDIEAGDSDALLQANIREFRDVTLTRSGSATAPVLDLKTDEEDIPFAGFNLSDDAQWEIRLTDEVPLTLNVNGGVGDSSIDLTNIQLQALTLDGGVGDVDVSLPEMETRYSASINTGVGQIDVVVEENTQLDLTLNSGVGDVMLDLGDEISGTIVIEGGVGSTVLDIEDDTAFRIEVQNGLGSVNLPANLVRISGEDQDGVWETEDFDAETGLRIRYNGGVGSLTLR